MDTERGNNFCLIWLQDGEAKWSRLHFWICHGPTGRCYQMLLACRVNLSFKPVMIITLSWNRTICGHKLSKWCWHRCWHQSLSQHYGRIKHEVFPNIQGHGWSANVIRTCQEFLLSCLSSRLLSVSGIHTGRGSDPHTEHKERWTEDNGEENGHAFKATFCVFNHGGTHWCEH